MSDYPSASWAGLCATTESNQPHEWVPILWVLRNRLEDPRWPDDMVGVVRQPYQFSAFNETKDLSDDEAFEAIQGRRWQVPGAVSAATYVLRAQRWQAPFGPKVCHFWSRISMVPRGSDPSWAEKAKRRIVLPGIAEERFIFAEGVP